MEDPLVELHKVESRKLARQCRVQLQSCITRMQTLENTPDTELVNYTGTPDCYYRIMHDLIRVVSQLDRLVKSTVELAKSRQYRPELN